MNPAPCQSCQSCQFVPNPCRIPANPPSFTFGRRNWAMIGFFFHCLLLSLSRSNHLIPSFSSCPLSASSTAPRSARPRLELTIHLHCLTSSSLAIEPPPCPIMSGAQPTSDPSVEQPEAAKSADQPTASTSNPATGAPDLPAATTSAAGAAAAEAEAAAAATTAAHAAGDVPAAPVPALLPASHWADLPQVRPHEPSCSRCHRRK